MLLREFRHAARSLARVPSLTAISIVTVALGVGSGTALFSVVKAVLLNPLPYAEPGRLAWVAEVNDHGRQTQVAYQNFLDWRAQNRSFRTVAAFYRTPGDRVRRRRPAEHQGGGGGARFLRRDAAQPVIGRGPSPRMSRSSAALRWW